jgi:predicted ABC-type transport system involved in lysophospholipase L1 biosynthesis ATPase subunit
VTENSPELPAVLDLRNVTKTYGEGETAVHAVAGVSLVVQQGDYLAVMGASGSGKSSLMNIIGCLDMPTRGSYRLDGVDVRLLADRQLSIIRNSKIGFIFQSFNLIARTTALGNVELPLAYAGVPAKTRRARAASLWSRSGSQTGCSTHLPSCPADSNNESRSPARSSPSPFFCLPTSRPARSTRAARPRCLHCSTPCPPRAARLC